MPEGDVIRRSAVRLDQAFAGQVLTRCDLRWPSVATVDLTNTTVLGTHSYGKHLLTRLSDGRTLRTHFRMDGMWFIHRTRTPEQRFTDHRIRAIIGTQKWTAIGVLLGMVDVVATTDERLLLDGLGPDVLAESLDTATILKNFARNPAVAISEALLNQENLAGVGTIFMAESLFINQQSPWQPVGEVNPVQLTRIVETARAELLRSVKVGHPNTTGDPRPGRVVWTHGRAGQRCFRCSGRIVSQPVTVHGHRRPVFHCPQCQEATTARGA